MFWHRSYFPVPVRVFFDVYLLKTFICCISIQSESTAFSQKIIILFSLGNYSSPDSLKKNPDSWKYICIK